MCRGRNVQPLPEHQWHFLRFDRARRPSPRWSRFAARSRSSNRASPPWSARPCANAWSAECRASSSSPMPERRAASSTSTAVAIDWCRRELDRVRVAVGGGNRRARRRRRLPTRTRAPVPRRRARRGGGIRRAAGRAHRSHPRRWRLRGRRSRGVARVACAAAGIDRPAGVVLISPWLDLAVDAPSYESRAATDNLFSADAARQAAASYLAGHDAADPLASPVEADVRVFRPPSCSRRRRGAARRRGGDLGSPGRRGSIGGVARCRRHAARVADTGARAAGVRRRPRRHRGIRGEGSR